MDFLYNKTSIGYSHINLKSPCQDYSEIYVDKKFKIITVCDGHGGKLYIRSKIGAKLASNSVIEVFKKYSEKRLESIIINHGLDKLKLEILCKWNEYIEKDYSMNHFNKEEISLLSEDEIFRLENNYVLAYGTTLNASILTKKYLICIQIGDGGIYLIKKKKIINVFPQNDNNVANITNSLCEDRAYLHLHILSVKKNKYNGVIMCSDGLLTPYNTYDNFYDNFVIPFLIKFKIITKKNIEEIDEFIDLLGNKVGNGDDVSLACMLYER